MIEVDVKRRAGGDAASDERICAGEVFAVDVAAHLQGQLLEVLDRTAFRAGRQRYDMESRSGS